MDHWTPSPCIYMPWGELVCGDGDVIEGFARVPKKQKTENTNVIKEELNRFVDKDKCTCSAYTPLLKKCKCKDASNISRLNQDYNSYNQCFIRDKAILTVDNKGKFKCVDCSKDKLNEKCPL